MADKINSKVFDYVSTSTDNTAVDIFNKPKRLGSKDVHNTLSLIGMIPGIGEPADALDSFLYAKEGNYKDAAISLASMIPIIGGAKNAKKLLEFAKETRLKKADKLASEMVDRDILGVASREPLHGKYKEIPKLREEADMIDLELKKYIHKEKEDYYMRTIGRVPKYLKDK